MVAGLQFRAGGSAWTAPLPASRILLLDDEADSREMLRSSLQAGDLVLHSPRPLESDLQNVISEQQPDVIFLHLDGGRDKLLSWIRQLRAGGWRCPILLLVAAGQADIGMEGLRCGAYDCLVEPCTTQQMQAMVRRALEYWQLQVQNEQHRMHLDQMIAARTDTLQRAMRQIERSYDVTLEALGDALDLKDAETEGHSKRVTAYSLALGRAVGLREAELRVVGRGAFLHDIGKMAIPDSILRKPGKLTAEERNVMRTHSELGYQMLRKIPFLHDAAEIVFSHQECYDGSGYPRRLRGEQIPMGARIFALADTLDAMTSTRPYRQATTISMAQREILRCAGSQFDPAIVDVFLAIPDSLWQDLREGIMRDGSAFSPFGFTFGDVI